MQTLGAGVARLGSAMAAVQQPPARHTQLGRNSSGQQLGLVVAALACPSRAGGRPGDDIDLADPNPAHHQPGQLASHGAPVAILQPVHHLTGNPLERQGRGDARVADPGGCAGQGEATTVAESGPGLVAPGAERGEEHGGIGTRRV